VHILFLSDNFPPEMNAPASRTYEHAKRWVAHGHEVTVITGFPNFPAGKLYPGYRNVPARWEEMDGIRVLRVWTYITANEGFLRRSLDYASFMLSATVAAPFVRRPDVVVATSPQIFTAVAGYMFSIVKQRPFVFELRDLWPDSIVTVGAMRESRLISVLRGLEYFLYRRADRIVSVTHSFKEVLTRNGIPGEKIAVVPNGADLHTYRPGEAPAGLRGRLGLTGKFVAAYIGTVGMAHGLRILLDAAATLRQSDQDIRLLVVGAGAEKAALEHEAAQRGLDNLVFVGAVAKHEIPDYWRLCDVALVLLKDNPLFRHVIPSKMFEAMSTERPVVLGVQGESRLILERASAGIAIAPEDPEALVASLRALRNQADDRKRMGSAGRRYVETHYDRDVLAREMLTILEALCASASRCAHS
jgi:glycosyltransferase involved in cell wall biosynthesis